MIILNDVLLYVINDEITFYLPLSKQLLYIIKLDQLGILEQIKHKTYTLTMRPEVDKTYFVII